MDYLRSKLSAPGLFVLAFTLLLMAACSGSRSADDTARLFLDQYLVAADQHAAMKLTTGRATERLQQEIELLSNFEGRAEALQKVKPEVRFEKLQEQSLPNGDIALAYAVKIKRPGVEVPERDIFLMLTKVNDEYKVKSFTFRSPTDNRTSNTP